MCRLEKSFVCLSLKTGGLIIGWLNIAACVVGFFYSIVMVALINNGTESNCDRNAEYDKCIDERSYLLILLRVLAVANAISVIPSALLIHGIRQDRHGLLKPWLVFTALNIVSSALRLLFNVAEESSIELILAAFCIALFIYFYLCIYSLYTKILENSINNLRNKV